MRTVRFDLEPDRDPADDAVDDTAGTGPAGPAGLAVRQGRRRGGRATRLLLGAGVAGVLALAAVVAVQALATDDLVPGPRPAPGTPPTDAAEPEAGPGAPPAPVAPTIDVAVPVPLASAEDAPVAAEIGFDSWTPEPTPLAPDDVAALEEACAGTRAGDRTTVLTERRGRFQLLLGASEGGISTCFVADGVVAADVTTAPGGAAVELGDAGVLILGATGAGAGPSDGDDRASFAYGLVDRDVDAVTLARPDGVEVRATVADGWWGVWWPGELDEDATLTLHGAEAVSVPVDDAWWRP